jgi:ubiquitin-protein ligase E3 A
MMTSNARSEQTAFLDESKLNDMIELCEETKNYAPIIRALGLVFSNREPLAKSFQRKAKSSIEVILDRVPQPSAIKTMKKEELRTLEDDEKDHDSMEMEEDKEIRDPTYTSVDLESLRRIFTKLHEKNSAVFEALDNAIQSLATQMQLDIRFMREKDEFEDVLCCIVILFEIFQIGFNLLEQSITRMVATTSSLPVWIQARLVHIWSAHCKDGLQTILLILQQMITLQVIANTYHSDLLVNDDQKVKNAVNVMKIVFCANLLASEKIDTPKYIEMEDASNDALDDDDDDFSSIVYQVDATKTTKLYEDPLMKELNISIYDCNKSFIPFEEFQNEPLCDVIDTYGDYLRYSAVVLKGSGFATSTSFDKFSFILNSFVLTPAAKTLALCFDSRVKMHTGTTPFNLAYLSNPYLKLKIRRDFLIDDALAELEMVAITNPKDLKKQIFIEFDGEQGIDEGGVSKEFFQLICEEIFNQDFGMFLTNEDTQTCWFNSFSFENDAQFTLIGIVLGLAIYNSIILPLNFPMAVYKKLLNVRVTWHDLKDWNPLVYNSLKAMLEYMESDFEDVFSQTFEIGYENIFGAPLKHSLKKNGDQIVVNHHNKHEFVELYADFLLTKSIEKQFRAFKKGFQMVTDESPLKLLFRPEEIELIVCGSNNFDFDELEKSTEYEGGYTAETEIIKHFWSTVHSLSLESKRKLLQFTTGEKIFV